jgi:(S)-ureidoglycine aminohydrolase
MPLISSATTRSALRPTHLLHTPESFVRTPMPGIADGLAVVHACPALGAGFLQFTAELGPGGVLTQGLNQRLLYVISGYGQLTLERENYADHEPPTHELRPGSYMFLPTGEQFRLEALGDTRVLVIEKAFEPHEHVAAPLVLVAHESDVKAEPLFGDEALQVRALLPAGPMHDFAVNTMAYAPGCALPQVEIHYMEHGLLMLEGEGLYLLGETWYPVQAGDFIWMAPYCPQQFMAASNGAKYLIYKNFNRAPAL